LIFITTTQMTIRDFLWFAVGMSIGVLGMIAYNEYYDLHPVYHPPKSEWDAFMNIPHSDTTLLFNINDFTMSSILLLIGLSLLATGSLLREDNIYKKPLKNVGLGMIILGSFGFFTTGLMIFILREQFHYFNATNSCKKND